jgi:hypothetical protein
MIRFRSICLTMLWAVILVACQTTPEVLPETAPLSSARTAVVQEPVRLPGYLCIYYGYPSLVNGANGNISQATAHFAKYGLIVLGERLWSTPDRDNSKTIIGNLRLQAKLTFGYVNLGVMGSGVRNLTLTEIENEIKQWQEMGVQGIFFDTAGYDYGVTRARQNSAIALCRKYRLRVFMNAWNPDDVLAGTDCRLTSQDFFLLESFFVGNDQYMGFEAAKAKADKCQQYRASRGVRMACVMSGGAPLSATYNQSNDKFNLAWVATAMYNFDFFQATDINYSASDNVLRYFPNISTNYGRRFMEQVRAESPTVFARNTESWTLKISGAGTGWGWGTFVRR